MDYRGRKTAVIHIGTMKVGTTSIQQFMAENQKEIYAKSGLWPICQYVRTPDRLREVLKADRAEGKSLMICDEGIWHHALVSKHVDLPGIRDVLSDYSFKVILYVRRPDEFLESWYLQGLKSGTGATTVDKFLKSPSLREGMNFQGRLPKIAKLFGGVTVQAYERSQLLGGDAISDFLSFCGIEPEGLVMPPKANKTPDPNALMMARVMRELVGHKDHDILRRAAEQFSSKEKYSILTPDEINEINRRYSAEITFLQKRYGKSNRVSFFDAEPVIPPESEQRSIRLIYESSMRELARQKRVQ